MKSEREIRKYLRALREANAEPCDCGHEHREECRAGAYALEATIQVLEWLLDDGDGSYDHVVEHFAARMARG